MTLDGGAGNDQFTVDSAPLSGGALSLRGGTGDDTMVGLSVFGNALGVNGADDTVSLGADNDAFVFDSDLETDDTVDGGAGTDLLVIQLDASEGIDIDFSIAADTDQVFGGDLSSGDIRNFENLEAIYSEIPSVYNVTMGGGTTSIVTSDDQDNIYTTAANLNAGDTIEGNGDIDTLNLIGGGTNTFNMATAVITEIESVVDDASVDNTTLTVNDLADLTITMDDGDDTVILGAGEGQSVNGGLGDDSISLGLAADQTAIGGDGNDTIAATTATLDATDSLNGGGSFNLAMLLVGSGETASNFEVIQLTSNTGTTVIMHDDDVVTINGTGVGAGADDDITLSSNPVLSQIINSGDGED